MRPMLSIKHTNTCNITSRYRTRTLEDMCLLWVNDLNSNVQASSVLRSHTVEQSVLQNAQSMALKRCRVKQLCK